MTRNKAIDRTQKLLILAVRTTFPHERCTAAWSATELCRKENLTPLFFNQLWDINMICLHESLKTCQVSP